MIWIFAQFIRKELKEERYAGEVEADGDGGRFVRPNPSWRSMRIAQLAPLVDTVPPRGIAPVQRLIHHLVEALAERGDDVTLFASAELETRAKLHALPSISLGSNRRVEYAAKIMLFERGICSDESFDVTH